jgi:hypothetical protein
MSEGWQKDSWEELAQKADAGMRGQGPLVEATHRLVVATDKLERSNVQWSKVIVWLTVALFVAAAVPIALAIWPHMLGG